MIIAFPAASRFEVKFECDGVAHGDQRGLNGFLGEDRAAKIGVKHRTS